MSSRNFAKNILNDFQKLLEKNEYAALNNIDLFLKEHQEKFIELKSQEFIQQGKTVQNAVNSARQSGDLWLVICLLD